MTTVIPEKKKETKLEDCHACKPDQITKTNITAETDNMMAK